MVTPSIPTSTSVQFLNRLIAQLSKHQPDSDGNDYHPATQNLQDQTPNPLAKLPLHQLSSAKPLLLTLHCLFPNELLLALDIVDRGLACRFTRADTPSSSPNTLRQQSQNTPALSDKQDEDIFFVLSASTVSSSASWHREKDRGYEVRLQAWNCTCPTFSLLAFRDNLSVPEDYGSGTDSVDDQGACHVFGGSLTREAARTSPPVCKHLLACVLMANCPGIFDAREERRRLVSEGEMAGLCAGWSG